MQFGFFPFGPTWFGANWAEKFTWLVWFGLRIRMGCVVVVLLEPPPGAGRRRLGRPPLAMAAPPWRSSLGALGFGGLGAWVAQGEREQGCGPGAGRRHGRRRQAAGAAAPLPCVRGRQKQRREEASVRKKEGRREGEEKKEKEEFRGVLCKWFRLILLLC